MATNTVNYNLVKDAPNEFYDVVKVNSNLDLIDANLKAIEIKAINPNFQTAGGTANAITLSAFALTNGNSISFVVALSNSAATTINGLPLYKPNTVITPTLTTGKAVTVWYNTAGNCFFIKASAEGDAVVAEVLAGKTFSNGDDTGLVGTIASKGAQTYTPSTVNQTIAAGQYLSGVQTIVGDADLVGPKILNTANIFGVQGTIPSKVAATYTPSAANQIIAAGQYLSGVQTVAGDADLVWGNIRAGANLFGVDGKYSVVDVSACNLGDASKVLVGTSAFTSFGELVNGTAIAGKQFASGVTASSAGTVVFNNVGGSRAFYTLTVTLPFYPETIVISYLGGPNFYETTYHPLGGVHLGEIQVRSIIENIHYVVLNNGPVVVDPWGFTLPVYGAEVYSWIAYGF